MGQIQLGNITIDIEKKNIKNINLRVYPPDGNVKITAPYRVNQETIRSFALSKLEWIKKQQARVKSMAVDQPKILVSGERHYFFGNLYSLEVMETEGASGIQLAGQSMIMHIHPGTTLEKRQKLLDQWYRAHLRKLIPQLVEKWEGRMLVKVKEFGIKKMKTRWGTCNRKAGRIWLNLELAKKAPECLEYVVVHEMVHLLERNHNKRFYSLMDEFHPGWKMYKARLQSTA